MTREEAKPYIGELKMYAKSKGWDEEYLIACDIAIDTMRKYQRIEHIFDARLLEPWEMLEEIKRVVEDGKTD